VKAPSGAGDTGVLGSRDIAFLSVPEAAMAGKFETYMDKGGKILSRLTAGAGAVVASGAAGS
jgi:hypothetical protein